MSEILANKLSPSTGTSVQLGDSGDTFNIPSGVTLTNSGTMNASAITAGTLPIARGGTGSTSTTFVNAATNITGNLPVANLNGGSSASSSTFWRGDGAWAAAGISKYFLIHLSGDFSFNTGNWTKVQWGSVQHNTGMTWDSGNYRLTPGATGIYLFINHCAGEGIDNEKEYDVQMYKNGSSAQYGNKYWYSAKTGSHPMVTATYVLKVTSASDYFETYVYTNNSTNEHVAQNQSYFSCIKIGDI